MGCVVARDFFKEPGGNRGFSLHWKDCLQGGRNTGIENKLWTDLRDQIFYSFHDSQAIPHRGPIFAERHRPGGHGGARFSCLLVVFRLLHKEVTKKIED